MLSSPESAKVGDSTLLVERVDALASRLEEMDSRVRAAEIATGDEKTAKELRKAIEVLSKHDPKREERLTNRVDVLADRLNTLATTVSTTAAGLAGKDGEIVGLRHELESGRTTIEALVAEVRRSAGAADIDELRRAIAAVSAERLARHDDKQIAELTRKVEFLAERVDTLSSTVATTAAGLAGREGELSNLRRRLEEDTARVTRAVAELRETRENSDLTPRVTTLSSAVAAMAKDLAEREHELTELRARLEDGITRVDSTVAGLGEALGATASRVDAVEAAVTAGAEKEIEIAALGRRFEHASASVDGLVEDLRQAIATMPSGGAEAAAVESGLAELQQTVSALGHRLQQLEERALTEPSPGESSDPTELEGRLTDLTERLVSVVRERGAATAELARTTAYWSSELASIDARFDELGVRLDSLERSDGPARASSTPAPGDGRFRLELRSLELRMEHAEAAAREHREAVLTQLERLASQIDRHLRRPESEHEPASDERTASIDAQVVPISGATP